MTKQILVKKILSRFLMLVVVLFGVTLLSFMFANLSPTDPAEAVVRLKTNNPSPQQIAEMREMMGLNKPFVIQYSLWIGNVFKGDWGRSYITQRAVADEIPSKIMATLTLVAVSFIFTVLMTIPISVICAAKRNSYIDHIIKIGSILGFSLPNFWVGCMLLAFFALAIPIFKVVDFGSLKSTILPSVALAIPISAYSIRVLRSILVETYQSDFVTYARTRGLPEYKIIKLVLKNSLPPIITLFFQQLGITVASSATIEAVFSWPGIGSHMISAILNRDLPVINGCVLIIAVIIVILNSTADTVNHLINPMMRNIRGGYHA